MSQSLDSAAALADLLLIAEHELERSERFIDPAARWQLPWILRICWSGDLPVFFRIEELIRMLEPGANIEELRSHFSVLTRVFQNCSVAELAAAMEKYLKQVGELQDRVLEVGTFITNIPEEKIEHMPVGLPHSRARQLAGYALENRAVLVESIVKALLIWHAAQASPLPEQASKSSRGETGRQKRAIIRKHIARPADWNDNVKVAAAFAELDRFEIPLPDKTIKLRNGTTKRIHRVGTWSELLKNKAWRKVFLKTLKRDLNMRTTSKSGAKDFKNPKITK